MKKKIISMSQIPNIQSLYRGKFIQTGGSCRKKEKRQLLIFGGQPFKMIERRIETKRHEFLKMIKIIKQPTEFPPPSTSASIRKRRQFNMSAPSSMKVRGSQSAQLGPSPIHHTHREILRPSNRENKLLSLLSSFFQRRQQISKFNHQQKQFSKRDFIPINAIQVNPPKHKVHREVQSKKRTREMRKETVAGEKKIQPWESKDFELGP